MSRALTVLLGISASLAFATAARRDPGRAVGSEDGLFTPAALKEELL